MQLTSVFNTKETIPSKYTADGENINPYLTITNIPENTNSLTIIMDDPDAQRVAGHTWIHWVVINIPITGSNILIRENSIPQGSIQLKNSGSKNIYQGPSPPRGSGIHHYHFKVYALDIQLELTDSNTKEDVEKAMEEHILDKAELIGIYTRGLKKIRFTNLN